MSGSCASFKYVSMVGGDIFLCRDPLAHASCLKMGH